MPYTPNDFRDDIIKEMEKGYDPIRIAQFAFDIYDELNVETSTEFHNGIQGVMLMEAGPEFVMTEAQLRNYLDKMVEELGRD